MTEAQQRPPLPSEAEVEAAIRAALAGAARTIDPAVPAQALVREGEWQVMLPLVRRVAIRLAGEGVIGIYRKGKPVDPANFRGVYRLGPPPASKEPASDEAAAG